SDYHIDFDDGDKNVVDASRVALDKAPKKDDVQAGTRVLAKFQQKNFFPGKIAAIADGKYSIKFDDGDEDTVTLEELRLITKVAGVTAQDKPKQGDIVWAEWKPNAWFHGKIAKVAGKDFHIAFDDGDKNVVDISRVAIDRAPKKNDVKVDTRVLA